MKNGILAIVCLVIGGTACASERTPADSSAVEQETPTVVVPGLNGAPPSDATVLLGDDLSAWEVWAARSKDSTPGDEAGWRIEDGIVTVVPGKGGIQTRQSFGSVQLHLEWRAPRMNTAGQKRGNSGVFLQERYEVQVLDSYRSYTEPNRQAASIYRQHSPLVNASLPPEEWQTYDIVFEAPDFDADGKLLRPAFVTVFHNGVLVQHRAEIQGGTSAKGEAYYEAHGDAPLALQDHGDLVSYRNIWIREL